MSVLSALSPSKSICLSPRLSSILRTASHLNPPQLILWVHVPSWSSKQPGGYLPVPGQHFRVKLLVIQLKTDNRQPWPVYLAILDIHFLTLVFNPVMASLRLSQCQCFMFYLFIHPSYQSSLIWKVYIYFRSFHDKVLWENTFRE